MNFYQDKNNKLLESVEGGEEINPLEVLKLSIDNWTKSGKQVPTLTLREVTTQNISKLVNQLKDSNAWGFDELESKVIKLAAKHLITSITFITNLSIRTSTFPNKWKLGRILPQYKGKNLPKHLPASYCPITMLPTISKIAERVVQEQIAQHMEAGNLYHPNHHAYRKGHGTGTALLELSDAMYEASEKNEISVSVAINQSSAFDCICHNILNSKLEMYGFDEKSRLWIESYLKLQSQFVEVGTKTSSIRPVT